MRRVNACGECSGDPEWFPEDVRGFVDGGDGMWPVGRLVGWQSGIFPQEWGIAAEAIFHRRRLRRHSKTPFFAQQVSDERPSCNLSLGVSKTSETAGVSSGSAVFRCWWAGAGGGGV